MPRLDIIMVDVYTQLYASRAGFAFPPRMTANPLILYNLGTLAWGLQGSRICQNSDSRTRRTPRRFLDLGTDLGDRTPKSGLYTPAIANNHGNHTKMGLEQLLVLIERSPMMHGKILTFSIRKLRKVVFH